MWWGDHRAVVARAFTNHPEPKRLCIARRRTAKEAWSTSAKSPKNFPTRLPREEALALSKGKQHELTYYRRVLARFLAEAKYNSKTNILLFH
jgi:hypothetical protein